MSIYRDISDDDLRQLFDCSVVRYNKIPVSLRALGDETLLLNSIGGAEYQNHKVKVTDELFDFTPVPLGFCNMDGETAFLARRPARQFSVGLTSRTLNISPIANIRISEHTIYNIQRFRGEGVRNCINGVYPTLEEAFDMLDKKEAKAVGIDRSFAVDREHRLYFKENCIGLIEKGRPMFFHSKNYMKVLWERGYAKA